jgi:hypothetical protein
MISGFGDRVPVAGHLRPTDLHQGLRARRPGTLNGNPAGDAPPMPCTVGVAPQSWSGVKSLHS